MSADIAHSNSLADLAARINAEHEAAEGAIKRGVEHAISAGELLIEAKGSIPHGQWLPWLEANVSFGDRQARNYMRIARHWQEIAGKSESVADLTIRDAVALLTEPKVEHEPQLIPVVAYDPRPPEPGEIEIPIADVRFLRDLYPRINFHLELVSRYGEFLSDLPPIEINQHNELIDGWHRLEAHKRVGAEKIRVVVTQVANTIEHLCIAVSRNAAHGLQLPLQAERRARGRLAWPR